MNWINKQQAKRYWDFATLGKFKWYLCGIFFLTAISKGVKVGGFSPHQVEESIRQYVAWQAQYEAYNSLLYWNSIWVDSIFWSPVGLTFSGILIFILVVATLRDE